MITTSNFSRSLNQRKRRCEGFQSLVNKVAGFRPEVILTTFYPLEGGYTCEVAYADRSSFDLLIQKLVDAIDKEKGIKLVSSALAKRKDLATFIPQKVQLSSYFTAGNKQNSPVVSLEEELLKAYDYDLAEGYYFAIPFPPKQNQPEGIFFLITKDLKEAVAVEANMEELLEGIKKT